MLFRPGAIRGVIVRQLNKYYDGRGWLCELFRQDDLPASLAPVMAYFSETRPGVTRGPHEHVHQTDCFCFFGPSSFRIELWDNRAGSPTHSYYQSLYAGIDQPAMVVIPPGVVHCYTNIGTDAGLVFNAPNQLYKGKDRREPVDEIRHEEDVNSPFVPIRAECINTRRVVHAESSSDVLHIQPGKPARRSR
jgi:dTDP-4-dehydrorhamnose 3,5-epimerase